MPKLKLTLANVLVIVVLTVLVLVLVALGGLPLGISGEGQWSWFYKSNVQFTFYDMLILITLGVIGLIFALLINKSKKSVIFSTLTIFLAIISYFALVLLIYNPEELVTWIRQHGDLPYYVYVQPMNDLSVIEVIRNYLPSVVTDSNEYFGGDIQRTALGTHPPGSMLLFLFAHRLTFVLQDFGMGDYVYFSYYSAIIRLLFNIIPIAGITLLVRELSDRQSAIRSVVLLCLLPAFIFFALTPSSFEIAFITFGLLFIFKATRSKGFMYYLYTILSGLILVLGTFFSFGLFSLYLVVLLLLIGLVRLKKISIYKALNSLTVFVSLLIAWTFIADIFLGYNYLIGWQQSQIVHQAIISTRGYLEWLLVNIYDFLLFLGLPLTITFFIFSKYINKTLKYPLWLLYAIAILALLIIDMLGIARGEVARIWLFLTPLFIMPVAIMLGKFKNSLFSSGLVFSLMLITVYVMSKYIYVVNLR